MRGIHFNNIGLSTRMFIMVFFLSMAVFVPSSVVSYYASKQKMESRMAREVFDFVNLTMARISSFLDNSQNLVFFIAAGQNIPMTDKNELIAEFIKNYAANNQLFSKTIYYLDLTDLTGNSTGKVICNKQVYYDIMGNPMLDVLAEKAWDNFGSISWSQPYHSPVSGTTVAVVYPVEGKAGERLGVFIVEISLPEISEVLDRLFVSNGRSYVLMTSEGNVIALDKSNAHLPYPGGIAGNSLTEETLNLLSECREGVSHKKVNKTDLIIVKSRRNMTGWVIYSIMDRKTFYTDLNSLAKTQLSASLIWILILLFFAIFISRNFSKPINDLINHMSSYKNPETASPIPISRRDEIGALEESYNLLLETIKNLIREVKNKEQEKNQYELNMLQSQIQPHFLYNTLACIGSLAKQERIDEVRNTIFSLVNLLSFTFDKPAEIVCLSEELEAAGMYVQIQKMRFGDIFDIRFEATEEAMNKKIPKLTLQPVIENAIVNSLIPKNQKNGIILLKASVRDSCLYITVEDNGLGLKKEKMEDFKRRKYDHRALDVFSHVGMINSDNRLKLYYGPRYGISVSFGENEKPVVSIVLPV